jgi:hypothetical protein
MRAINFSLPQENPADKLFPWFLLLRHYLDNEFTIPLPGRSLEGVPSLHLSIYIIIF